MCLRRTRLQNWGFWSVKCPHTYHEHICTCPVSLSPFPVPWQLPLSEVRPFTRSQHSALSFDRLFFNDFKQFASPFLQLRHLRDWNKDAWRAITESSHSPKHFDILPTAGNGRKNKVLSNLFWFILLSQQINTPKIASPILTLRCCTMP